MQPYKKQKKLSNFDPEEECGNFQQEDNHTTSGPFSDVLWEVIECLRDLKELAEEGQELA